MLNASIQFQPSDESDASWHRVAEYQLSSILYKMVNYSGIVTFQWLREENVGNGKVFSSSKCELGVVSLFLVGLKFKPSYKLASSWRRKVIGQV